MKTKLPSRYWTAYKALHGDQLELAEAKVLGKPKAPPRPRGCPDEDFEHLRSAAWLRREGIAHHHSPNGEKRDRHVGAKLKAMGTSPGFPDFFIPGWGQIDGKRYPILFIELKALDGTVSGSSRPGSTCSMPVVIMPVWHTDFPSCNPLCKITSRNESWPNKKLLLLSLQSPLLLLHSADPAIPAGVLPRCLPVRPCKTCPATRSSRPRLPMKPSGRGGLMNSSAHRRQA